MSTADDLGDSPAQAMRASRSASCSSAGSPDQARAPHRANRSSPTRSLRFETAR